MKLNTENMIEYLKTNSIYHGSREGLHGRIKPSSRPDCDFGPGFYMGTNIEQTKGLIASYPAPISYTIKLNTTTIPQNKIVTLTGSQWLNTILGFRSDNEELRNCPPIKRAMALVQNADIVIGPIADDRMVRAVQQFEQGFMTDKALLACLKDVDYGVQIVAKSQLACDCIEIQEQHELTIIEKRRAVEFNEYKRNEGNDSIKNAQRKFGRDGLFIEEFIQRGYDNQNKTAELTAKIEESAKEVEQEDDASFTDN